MKRGRKGRELREDTNKGNRRKRWERGNLNKRGKERKAI